MTLKYFTAANSAAGYVSFQNENLIGITKIFYLNNPEPQLVSRLLEDVLPVLGKRKLQPELIYSAFNPEYLEGIVIRELEIALISGGETVPPDTQVLDLMTLYNMETIKKNQPEIDELCANMNKSYQKMAMHMQAALLIHDEWESLYIDRMNFVKANAFGTAFLDSIFDGVIPVGNQEARVTSRFFGTSTPVGLTDFIPELTAGLRRFLIKGRPGSGKSTLMRRVLARAVELGYDADVYYCSLDPKSLDMVVIPELNFCIFDATPPHEYEPSFVSDTVIDTYAEFIAPDTDERLAGVIQSIEIKYNNQIRQARAAMKVGHESRAAMSKLYCEALMLAQYDDILVTLTDCLK